jgi:hypothetical protein
MPLYRVYFDCRTPLFAELYSVEIPEIYPNGIFGKKLFAECVYDFLIVKADNRDEALIKAKEDADKIL